MNPVLQSAQSQLQENGITQLSLLSTVAQETGVWTNSTLRSLLSNESPQTEKGERSFNMLHLKLHPFPYIVLGTM